MPKTTHQIRRAVLVMTFIMVLGLTRVAAADTLTLEWDLNTEPEVAGYTVYIGTQSGVYPQTIDVGNTSSFAFSNALAGQRYFFAVAAYGGSTVSPLSVEVSGISNPYPVLLNPGNQTGSVGQAVSLQLSGNDPLGDPITFSTTGLPPGLSLSQSLHAITGTPTTVGTYHVTATVNDGVLSASQSFTWTIGATNGAPNLTSPGNQTGTVGTSLVLQLVGSDPNGNSLTYSASNLPPGLQLTASTGRISGTPNTAGTYAVTVGVSDGALSAQRSFSWTIQTTRIAQPVNVAPVLTAPGNQMATVGQPASLQLQASDANGNALTFSASGLPSGLQIASATGAIAGTPTTVGTFQVTATVSDGALSAQRSFTWTVASVAVAAAPPPETGKNGKKNGRKASSTTTSGTTAVTRTTTSNVAPTSTLSGSEAVTRKKVGTTATTTPNVTYTGDAAVTRAVVSSSTAVYTGTSAKTRKSQDTAVSTTTTAPATLPTPKSTKRSVARSENDATSTQTLDLASARTAADPADVSQSTGVAQSRTTTAAVSIPTVVIQTPVDHASFAAESTIMFSATARDGEDGDVTSRIVWSSSLDGRIGTGGTVFKVLSNGTHTISATVTDSHGTSKTADITIVVGR